jgi:hypothetical protein
LEAIAPIAAGAIVALVPVFVVARRNFKKIRIRLIELTLER